MYVWQGLGLLQGSYTVALVKAKVECLFRPATAYYWRLSATAAGNQKQNGGMSNAGLIRGRITTDFDGYCLIRETYMSNCIYVMKVGTFY